MSTEKAFFPRQTANSGRITGMGFSSYLLILTLSFFSQAFLLSASKSMRTIEDDMLLNPFGLGKALQKEDIAEKSGAVPSLEHYKSEEGGFINEEESRNPKNIGSKHSFLNRGLLLNLALKQLPYLALKGSVAFPSDNGVQNIESTQERREIGDEENSVKFPIGRRDFDMLRCMLGRVYRPCWQI
ncbi:pro-MCH [Petaurus breviceps papuanus]|uniref:pro-MCH n=1 Tax=Petaurus breviceps papuanus TaxID=3040969 RepID=UPI0036DF8F60